MTDLPILTALGLMSGTSMDGIDAALVRTDGDRVIETGAALTVPYPAVFRERLREAVTCRAADIALADELTALHVQAVETLLARSAETDAVDVIGFHGHTILHDPARGRTVQIGDGEALAQATGMPVVFDFRSADVTAGGQGAPLVPIYHFALAGGGDEPIAVLNVGGVANVTWIAPDADPQTGDGILAFDTGPGNALIDDWARQTTGAPWDESGALAASGRVDTKRLTALLDHGYFERTPPKSLDRNTFMAEFHLEGCSPPDGAATLARFTAECVGRARDFFPAPAARWLVCGGGRRNRHLMGVLRAVLGAPVVAAEDAGWDGDALEAQAFAYLAVRHLGGLPQTFPTTTGAPGPRKGGRLVRP